MRLSLLEAIGKKEMRNRKRENQRKKRKGKKMENESQCESSKRLAR